MERLQESDPEKQQVTDEMRKALAAVDEKFDAKVAERKIFLTQKPVSYTHLTLPTSDLV